MGVMGSAGVLAQSASLQCGVYSWRGSIVSASLAPPCTLLLCQLADQRIALMPQYKLCAAPSHGRPIIFCCAACSLTQLSSHATDTSLNMPFQPAWLLL
jgi:hypothetical protein